jgi:sialic acid synthase SpsE
MKKIFEKSLVTRTSLKKNTIIRLKHLNFKKPGDGIRADNYKKIIGKKIKTDLPQNKQLRYSHFYK